MYNLMMTILDCVHKPQGKNKPHRKGNLVAEIGSEDPYHIELYGTGEDGDVYLHASVDVDTLDILVKTANEIKYQHDVSKNSNS